MSEIQTIDKTFLRIALAAGLATGLVLMAAPAYARGYHGRHHSGHGRHYRGYRIGHHGRHHGSYRHDGYSRGRHYAYRHGHHSYAYRPHYYSRRTHRSYPLYSHSSSYYRSPRYRPYTYDSRSYTSTREGVNYRRRSGDGGSSHGSTTQDGPTTRRTADTYDTDVPGHDRHGTVSGGGWALLSDGQYSQALRRFLVEAENNPSKGTPKVGYALASAGLGNLSRAVWAMRRAFSHDPDSVHYVVIDERLRPRVQHLVEQYDAILERTAHNSEAAFMLAALNYLLGDIESARTAIDLAIEDGGRNSSTTNLKRLIDKELSRDTQRGADHPSATIGPLQDSKLQPGDGD